MSNLNDAPAAPAPKASSFVKFEPFEEDGPQILTLVATNYIKEHEFENDKKEKYIGQALEFYFGTLINGQPRFIKTWPKAYSIKNTATYYRIYKAITGKEPQVGCKVSDIVGGGIQGTVTTSDKVGKKGTKYRVSTVDMKSLGPVMPKLKPEIVPLEKLLPALKKLLEAADKQEGEAQEPEGSNPF